LSVPPVSSDLSILFAPSVGNVFGKITTAIVDPAKIKTDRRNDDRLARRVALAFGEIENAVGSCRGIEELDVSVGPAHLDVLELRLGA
jgi:hypothetical protein